MELQVGVKIILKNREGKYLVVCRNPLKYPEVGAKWDIVGGRIDPGLPLVENLRREVKEETGLEIKYEPKLLTAQDILRPDKHVVRLTYVGIAEEGDVVLSEEHTEYKWLTPKEICQLDPLDSYLKDVLAHFDLS